MPEATFGEQLRGFRKRAGKTQAELATAIDVNFTYVSKIEQGKAPPPKRDRIEAAAKYLRLTEAEEIKLLSLAEKMPADVQDWMLEQPDAVRLYRSIKRASPRQQEEILEELIRKVEKRLEKRKRKR